MFWWFTSHLALVGAVVTRRAQSLDWLWSVSRVVVPHQRWRAGSLSQEADTRGTRCRNQLTGHQITIIGGEGEGGSNLRWGQKLCTCVKWLIRISNLLSQQLLLTHTAVAVWNTMAALLFSIYCPIDFLPLWDEMLLTRRIILTWHTWAIWSRFIKRLKHAWLMILEFHIIGMN